jgi:hypothetical protein
MNTSAESIQDWQGWLARFNQSVSAAGWRDFMSTALEGRVPIEQWAAVYVIPVQSALANAMLMACLQAPEASVETTLAGIARQAREARFGKAPRDLEKELREVYAQSTRNVARILPGTADLFMAIFSAYARGDYDLDGDANLLMREAQILSAARNRDAALAMIGRAGAAALHGSHLWSGWADEGGEEFLHWALSLATMLDGFGNILPLGDVASERGRAGERALTLSPAQTRADAAGDVEDDISERIGEQTLGESESFVSEWVALASRTQPLTDGEIAEMGERYGQFAELAVRVLEMHGTVADLPMEEDITELAATILGMLRYSEEHAISLLIRLIAAEGELANPTAADSAVWALEQMGARAVEEAFDYARYSSQVRARYEMLKVLAVAGRGTGEVFDYLAGQFTASTWASGKADYVLPLALTHDPRALALIVEALRDPAVGEDDAWELFDALQELEVEFFINKDTRAVSIPGFGVIDDVLPQDWRSRKEIEEEEEAELNALEDEWDEWDDEDEDDGEEDDEEYEDDVVYDKDGIPRCPDCGAEMHYIGGRWVHPPDAAPPQLAPPSPKPIGRNDPCWCGSGKKYKYCHGRDV